MNREDDFTRKFDKLHISTEAETDNKILEDAYAELDNAMQKGEIAVKQGHCHRTRRTRIMELVAVTVGIVIVLALFFSIPSAKAVSLAEIYQAVERVRNVCISSFRAGNEEPYENYWVSLSLNIRLIEDSRHIDLLDLNNWTSKELDVINNSVIESIIQSDLRKNIENFVINSIGLVPFSQISDVPKNSHWERVTNENINTVIPNTEVYNLTWKGSDNEFTTWYHKWRVFVDINTDLPVRTESYVKKLYHRRKSDSDDDYVLDRFIVVTYPTEAEILALIKNTFGQTQQQTVESENLNNSKTIQIDTNTSQ